jgi:2-polyprenyl-6-methoxyphenol hydroxylase-like FAD-dependent oxidoreductase
MPTAASTPMWLSAVPWSGCRGPADRDPPNGDLLDGWARSLRNLIAGSETVSVLRPIHALPPSLAWPRVPGVTLLGDAAHLMSPFTGEGANLAMDDGLELARTLIDHRGDRDSALAVYEHALFARSQPIAQLSASNLSRFFGPDAPTSVVDLFKNQ